MSYSVAVKYCCLDGAASPATANIGLGDVIHTAAQGHVWHHLACVRKLLSRTHSGVLLSMYVVKHNVLTRCVSNIRADSSQTQTTDYIVSCITQFQCSAHAQSYT